MSFTEKHKQIIEKLGELKNVPNTNNNKTPNSKDGESNSTSPMGGRRGTTRDDIRASIAKDFGDNREQQSSSSISDNSPSMDRPKKDTEVQKADEPTEQNGGDRPKSARTTKRVRGSGDSDKGTQSKDEGQEDIGGTSNVSVESVNDDNREFRKIGLLYPEQVDDVNKAWKRFDKGERGMLFTNGTGTGKTATGAGVIKTVWDSGQRNILIVTPSDTKNRDWIEEVKLFVGLDVKMLGGIKDGGEKDKIAITTYANFGLNKALLKRNFDLIVYDESHKLLASNTGQASSLTEAHYMNTNHSGFSWEKQYNLFMDEHGAIDARRTINRITGVTKLSKKKQFKLMEHIRGVVDNSATVEVATNKLSIDYGDNAHDLAKALFTVKKANELFFKGGEDNRIRKSIEDEGYNPHPTKVIFLSATPYKGHFSLDYTDELIHDIGIRSGNRNSYNEGDSRDRFYMNNFGYSMRYNKLNKPKAEVDVNSLEILFTEEAIKRGAMSGRVLKVDADYSRKFIKLKGDEVEKYIKGSSELIKLKKMGGFAHEWFYGHPRGEQMIEGLIGGWIIDRIKKHLAMGRKIVIFHKYREPTYDDVFNLRKAEITRYSPSLEEMYTREMRDDKEAYDEFKKWESENPSYSPLMNDMSVPMVIKKIFGKRAVFFSGKVPKAQRKKNIDRFNDDDGDVDIFVVQEQAGKEGISLHDRTGKNQRVMINCSKPYDPIAGIQIEGRIYRLGVITDAIFEYPIVGTSNEMWSYVNKINQRVGTTENLAMGASARGLSRAFKEGYLEASSEDPNENDGKGTRDEDFSKTDTSMTPFEKAKAQYHVTNPSGRSKQSGDFFGTPDPLGYMMGEWGDSKRGDSMLEPSAGAGAIARYFPEGREHTFIEMNDSNRDKLLGVVNDSNNIRPERTFEAYSTSFKHDVIVMNPPFGRQSKMAFDHTIKALQHLRDGGRVVSLCPNQKTMIKRMEEWDSRGFVIRAKLHMPSVTFERVGTKVMTTVYIIDKIPQDYVVSDSENYTKDISFTHINDINELFDRINTIGAIPRFKPLTDEEREKIKAERRQDAERLAKEIEELEQGLVDTYELPKAKAQWLRRVAYRTTSKPFDLKEAEKIFNKSFGSQEELANYLRVAK